MHVCGRVSFGRIILWALIEMLDDHVHAWTGSVRLGICCVRKRHMWMCIVMYALLILEMREY